MPHNNESLSSDDDSVGSYESALAEPLASSEDEMEPLRLANDQDAAAEALAAHRANPNAPAPGHAAQTLMHRLAQRVQAAAAGGPQDAGGPNSPQLNMLRQQQLQHQQIHQAQQMQHHQMQQAQQMQHLHQQAQQMQHHLQQQAHQMQHLQQVQQVHHFRQQVEQHLQQQAQQPQPQQEEGEAINPYKHACKHCPERFTHINLLTRHLNDVHPVSKPFVCPDCGRGYVNREVMEAHYLMLHRGERPYPCDQCEKVFARREYLVTHSRVHTGFKPYQCGDCGRRFAWKGCIDIHRRTHTGERPYLCITCSKDFATLSTLKMHEMIHTNSFPHPCTVPECDRKFRRFYDLRMHAQYHEDKADNAAEVNDSRTEDEVAVAILNEL